jgi:hypothetical protein
MDAFDLDLATSLTYLFLQGATCSCERSMLAKFSTNTLDVHLQPGENQMNIKLATISVLAAAFVFVSDMAIAKSNQLTDDQVKQRIIDDSIASYPGTCACPFNTARNGSSCGRRSAWSKAGGYSPVCYKKEVTKDMVKSGASRISNGEATFWLGVIAFGKQVTRWQNTVKAILSAWRAICSIIIGRAMSATSPQAGEVVEPLLEYACMCNV